MAEFLDGAAQGVNLLVRRAPKFLRVVRHRQKGTFDALDQLADQPELTEDVYAYRKVRDDGSVHLCIRGPSPNGSGWYAMASYEAVAEPPDDDTMRSTSAWRKWCEAEAAKERTVTT